MTFPNQQHTLAGIKGPLIIDGGTQAGQPTLVASVALPYEVHNKVVTEPDLQGQGVGNGEKDVVKIFDDGATTNQTGYLTDIPTADEFGVPVNVGNSDFFSGQGVNISGLDLPGTNTHYDSAGNVITTGDISHTSSTTHITTIYEAGIDIVNADAVQILLGTGDDHFNIDTASANTPNIAVATVNADDGLQTMMVVEGGGGSNTINVTHSLDPLVLYGNESASGIEYNSTERQNAVADGNGVKFTNFGSDVIDAAGATGTVIIVGGPLGDTLIGGSGTNWIAGGEGDDTISASGTVNYIFGDSSFTVGAVSSITFDEALSTTLDLSSRLMTIDNSLLLMDAGVNGNVQSAGSDTITVIGNGKSVVFGDYATVSIDGQIAGIVDPFASLGAPDIFTEMASVNTALGGDDVINVNNVNSSDVVIGGAGDDRIILGSGGQNVVLGDNGEIEYTNSGQVISGIPTEVAFGNHTITLTDGGSWASLGYRGRRGHIRRLVHRSERQWRDIQRRRPIPITRSAAISTDGETLTLKSGETLTVETSA